MHCRSHSMLADEEMRELRVFATTVVRGSIDHELSGFLFELDWQKGKIKEKIPIPVDTAHPFWNPRGGNRGGRGLFVYNGILYVATALSILKYDTNLRQIGELTHPYLTGLHEIFIESDGIWLTSTVHDLIIKIDFEGRVIDEWWGSQSPILQKALNFASRKLNLDFIFPEERFVEEYEKYCKEEILHLNAVWAGHKGIFVLANRKNALLRIRPLPEKIIFLDEQLANPHNLHIDTNSRIIINDTGNQCIRIYDLSSGKLSNTISTCIYDWKGPSEQFAKPGWQRGLAHVRDSLYLIGTSPATIFEVDIEKQNIGQKCVIDTDIKHCIHGLTATYSF